MTLQFSTLKALRTHTQDDQVVRVVSRTGCVDSDTASWVAWGTLHHDATYQRIQDQDPVPDMVCPLGESILFLDVTFSPDMMERLMAGDNRCVVICRTRSVLEVCVKCRVPHYFSPELSVAASTWNYYHPGEPLPKMVECVDDHVVGRGRIPFSTEVVRGMQTHDFSFEKWTALSGAPLGLKQDGEAVMRFHRLVVARMANQACIIHVAGHEVPCVTTPVLAEDAVDLMLQDPRYTDCPFVVTRREVGTPDGMEVRWDFWANTVEDVVDALQPHRVDGGPHHAWMVTPAQPLFLP